MKSAMENPWQSYKRVGSIAFGATFIGCSATTLAGYSVIKPTAYPEVYAGTLLAKCMFAGILWPAIPIRAITNPRGLFVVGSSINTIISIDDDQNSITKDFTIGKGKTQASVTTQKKDGNIITVKKITSLVDNQYVTITETIIKKPNGESTTTYEHTKVNNT
jgi:hypothetical protein